MANKIIYLGRNNTQNLDQLDLPASVIEDLDFALAAFYRKYGEDHLNFCYEATVDFGKMLLEKRFGEEGEQDFFKAHQGTGYAYLFGQRPFDRKRELDFHAVGALFLPNTNLALDLTHYGFEANKRTAIIQGDSEEMLLEMLCEKYENPSWERQYVLNPITGNFEWVN